MIASRDLDFSFSGLKTAALHCVRKHSPDDRLRADVAASFQAAVVDVLAAKCLRALEATGMDRLVVAGGVGANTALRERLARETARIGASVYFPPPRLCTDNGAMIAFAASLRFTAAPAGAEGFPVRPRWDLAGLAAA
jgi:N6-L-threonylcarbamoyladenine synthase